MRTLFTLSLRDNSSRLPGKVWEGITSNHSLATMALMRLEDAIRMSLLRPQLDPIVPAPMVCTSTETRDTICADFAYTRGALCYRGEPEDVLMRLLGAAKSVDADVLVNVTADNPLVSAYHLFQLAMYRHKHELDFVQPVGLPVGLYGQVVTRKALEQAVRHKALNDTATECWPKFFTDPSCPFSVEVGEMPVHLYAGGNQYRAKLLQKMRLTVDTLEDLEVVREVLRILGEAGQSKSVWSIVDVLQEHPEIMALNAGVTQKAVTPPKWRIRTHG